MGKEDDQIDESKRYDTFSYLPELEAACLRVLVLQNPAAKIDTLPDFVRFRIQSASETLDKCHRRIEALERFVEIMVTAEREAFSGLVEEVRADNAREQDNNEEKD
jgi:hypothetical protein